MNQIDRLHRKFSSTLQIKSPLKPSDWADRCRILSTASSSEPGPWRTKRTPYIKEILDNLSPSVMKVRKVILMKGHQIGYTEGVLMNGIGWVISECPGPCMLVAPTEKTVKKMQNQKLEPMIYDTPVVKEKISRHSKMSQRNNIVHKDFAGGFLVLSGSTVAADLAGTSVKYLFLDEVDRMLLDTGGEGSPVELAIGRTSAYNRKKIMMGSTPTDEENSVIQKYFLEGDQRYYYCPCPHCGHYQTMDFERLEWKMDGKEITDIWLNCEKCGEGIYEKHKTSMLEGGEWRATAECDPSIRSYHLSSMYSPVGFLSWKNVAVASIKAEKDIHFKKTFLNLFLGKPSSLTTEEVPRPEALMKREKKYVLSSLKELDLHDVFITAGVDIQADRIEALVIAWHGRTSWIIDKAIFWGNTNCDAYDGPWAMLTDLLDKRYTLCKGRKEKGKRIHSMAVDSGYIPHKIFSWYRETKQSKRVRIVKGQHYFDHGIISQPKRMEVAVHSGKRSKVGHKYYGLNTHLLKQEIYKKLLVEDDETDDYVHFPDEMEREFYEQLCSERMVLSNVHDIMNRTGTRRHKWIAIRQRNEALDMFVYALGMWYASNAPRYIDRWGKFVEVKDALVS